MNSVQLHFFVSKPNSPINIVNQMSWTFRVKWNSSSDCNFFFGCHIDSMILLPKQNRINGLTVINHVMRKKKRMEKKYRVMCQAMNVKLLQP